MFYVNDNINDHYLILPKVDIDTHTHTYTHAYAHLIDKKFSY